MAFGVLVQLMIEKGDCAEVDAVLSFSSSVGLPITLSEIGFHHKISHPQLLTIATRATAPDESIHNMPCEVTVDVVIDAILAADAAGQAFFQAKQNTQQNNNTTTNNI